MTPTELRTIGELLYGERWQSPLARDLGVDDRTVRGWLTGKGRPGAYTAVLLCTLAQRRDDIDRYLHSGIPKAS